MTDAMRLLIDAPLDGPANMARDEVLLDLAAAGETPATLRFYRWSVPTISLGRLQPYADMDCLTEVLKRLPVVRRLTGGGAILHDQELTYSLTVHRPHRLLADGPTVLYVRMHDAIIGVLRDLGVPACRRGPADGAQGGGNEPFFCFARAHRFDIVVGSMKLVGSAQHRRPRGVLQHGSIVLRPLHGDQPSTGVYEWCDIGLEELTRRIAARFAEANGLRVESDGWRTAELARAEQHAARYNSAAWTRRR